MQSKQAGKQVGRILSGDLRIARAEFTEEVSEGMLLYYTHKSKRYVLRVDRMETGKFSGLSGYLVFLDEPNTPPPTMQPLFVAEEEVEEGVINLGEDGRRLKIRVKLNPLYEHLLITGMTTMGKTHLLIVFAEELIALKVPLLIIDPHGEMTNLAERGEGVSVVEELRFEDLIAMMQRRMTVVYNLLGYGKASKISRVMELLHEIMVAKEKDYYQAANDYRLLTIPPILIMVDEGDIFAPNQRKGERADRSAVPKVIDIATRGSKFGIGLIIATQRIARLDIDVRSQCNSAAIFRLIEPSSIQVINSIDYLPGSETTRIPSLLKGQCIIGGRIVRRSRKMMVRDINTKRSKKRDFESMLNIDSSGEPQVFGQETEVTSNNDVLLEGKVVDPATKRAVREDAAAFEKTEGDGVILREEPLDPEVEKELTKQMKKKLPFATHLTEEDQEAIGNLRKKGIVTQ